MTSKVKVHKRDVRLLVNAGMDFPTCQADAPVLDLDKRLWKMTADTAKVTCEHCRLLEMLRRGEFMNDRQTIFTVEEQRRKAIRELANAWSALGYVERHAREALRQLNRDDAPIESVKERLNMILERVEKADTAIMKYMADGSN